MLSRKGLSVEGSGKASLKACEFQIEGRAHSCVQVQKNELGKNWKLNGELQGVEETVW